MYKTKKIDAEFHLETCGSLEYIFFIIIIIYKYHHKYHKICPTAVITTIFINLA